MSVKTYSLNSTKQLIDLNGDTKNFELSFSATSTDGGEFDALVVDQTTLDSTANLDYKKTVNGVIAGEIRSDKDVYQNYYLILKSDEKRDVTVTIDIKEISPAPQEPYIPQPPPVQEEEMIKHTSEPVSVVAPKTSSINWKLILIVLIVIGGGFLLYKFYTSKKDITTSDSKSKVFEPVKPIKLSSPVVASLPVAPPVVTSSPPVVTSSSPAVSSLPVAPSSTPQKQSSPSIVPIPPRESIDAFGFGDSGVNKGLLARLNNIKINNTK